MASNTSNMSDCVRWSKKKKNWDKFRDKVVLSLRMFENLPEDIKSSNQVAQMALPEESRQMWPALSAYGLVACMYLCLF